MSKEEEKKTHPSNNQLDEYAEKLLKSGSIVSKRKGIKLKIAFFGDFCYPRKGGVENHQWALAQELIRRGHKVIGITNTYYDKKKGVRQGIRWMKNGFKIYYTPTQPIFDQNSLPVIWFFSPLMRNIVLREDISIIHYHAASAFMSISMCVTFGCMGLHSIYTDHSLFPFSDAMYIHINKGSKCSLTECDQLICVSHICKENLTLRACLDPNIVNVIPNAVDTTKFRPPTNKELILNKLTHDVYYKTIYIVMVARMAFRKGFHLAVRVIPRICCKFSHVQFIIGGDGPQMILLQKMRNEYNLHDRVELIGAVPHIRVRDVLCRGHIFLNCSLTESFCIANLEAACCGLYVVSTNVGGIPEVLPNYMCSLAELDPEDITKKLIVAIEVTIYKINISTRYKWYNVLRRAYSWQYVAERTEIVYYNALKNKKETSLLNRMKKYYDIGPLLGKVLLLLVLVDWLLLKFWDWYYPKDQIEKAIDFPNVYESNDTNDNDESEIQII